jgi:hypothetical protein
MGDVPKVLKRDDESTYVFKATLTIGFSVVIDYEN